MIEDADGDDGVTVSFSTGQSRYTSGLVRYHCPGRYQVIASLHRLDGSTFNTILGYSTTLGDGVDRIFHRTFAPDEDDDF